WQALLAAAILLTSATLLEGPPNIAWNTASVAMLLYAGIPGTALAYWAAAVSSSGLPAAPTSPGLLATPPIRILLALLVLGEHPTLTLMLALALILVGMAIGISGPAADAPRR